MENVLTPTLHLHEIAKLKTFLTCQVSVIMQSSMLNVKRFCSEWCISKWERENF